MGLPVPAASVTMFTESFVTMMISPDASMPIYGFSPVPLHRMWGTPPMAFAKAESALHCAFAGWRSEFATTLRVWAQPARARQAASGQGVLAALAHGR